jgi:hypothetical protein
VLAKIALLLSSNLKIKPQRGLDAGGILDAEGIECDIKAYLNIYI